MLNSLYGKYGQDIERDSKMYIDVNLPENTMYFEKEGLWKWRDLYDHGYIDPDGYGVNHPFINNIHYVKNDINFYLRNERLYQNKTDGLTNFNDKTITDC